MDAAARTLTLREMKSPALTTTTEPHVHFYNRLITRDNFGQRSYVDTSLFYNVKEFTMKSNEQHQILLQATSFDQADINVYPARIDNDELSIDIQREPGQLCYALTLLTPNVAALTVGTKTSLSLLLRSFHLRVATYMLTDELATQLKQSCQERYLVSRQVNMDPTLVNANHPDSKKRRRPLLLDIPCGPYRPCSPTTTPPPLPPYVL